MSDERKEPDISKTFGGVTLTLYPDDPNIHVTIDGPKATLTPEDASDLQAALHNFRSVVHTRRDKLRTGARG